MLKPNTFQEAVYTLETLDRMEGHKLLNRDQLLSVIEFMRQFIAPARTTEVSGK